jgi:3-oxoacyl-[acyl-carrier-protein] synthase III
MLHAGVNLAKRTWESFKSELSWANDSVDRVVCHQVGSAHQKLIFETLCLDTARDYSTFAEYGNTGSAALPLTLAKAAEEGFIEKGHRVGLLGIGSGLNCLMLGVEW